MSKEKKRRNKSMYNLHKKGVSIMQIAITYKLNTKTVWEIINREKDREFNKKLKRIYPKKG